MEKKKGSSFVTTTRYDYDRKKALTIAVGQCASTQEGVDLRIDECPPTASNIYQGVTSAIEKR
jgi:hypothetical protein